MYEREREREFAVIWPWFDTGQDLPSCRYKRSKKAIFTSVGRSTLNGGTGSLFLTENNCLTLREG